MLDENVLIGSGTRNDTVRPLAYSTLADLVNHVRGSLTLVYHPHLWISRFALIPGLMRQDQLSRVVDIYSRNIQDPTLPLRIQTASVRLILNLVDHIYHHPQRPQVISF